MTTKEINVDITQILGEHSLSYSVVKKLAAEC